MVSMMRAFLAVLAMGIACACADAKPVVYVGSGGQILDHGDVDGAITSRVQKGVKREVRDMRVELDILEDKVKQQNEQIRNQTAANAQLAQAQRSAASALANMITQTAKATKDAMEKQRKEDEERDAKELSSAIGSMSDNVKTQVNFLSGKINSVAKAFTKALSIQKNETAHRFLRARSDVGESIKALRESVGKTAEQLQGSIDQLNVTDGQLDSRVTALEERATVHEKKLRMHEETRKEEEEKARKSEEAKKKAEAAAHAMLVKAEEAEKIRVAEEKEKKEPKWVAHDPIHKCKTTCGHKHHEYRGAVVCQEGGRRTGKVFADKDCKVPKIAPVVKNCPATNPCPINCTMSKWSEWTVCDAECGQGESHRSRTMITPAQFGGKACPPEIEWSQTEKCSMKKCPVDCKLSEWSPWSTCSKECGVGEKERVRTVVRESSHGGEQCHPELKQRHTCEIKKCVSWDVQLGQCPVRTRCGLPSMTVPASIRCIDTATRAVVDDALCLAEKSLGRPTIPAAVCPATAPCPRDCSWKPWGPWSTCSAKCGGGVQKRQRGQITAQNGGKQCSGSSTETKECNSAICPTWEIGPIPKKCPSHCGFQGATYTSTVTCSGDARLCGAKPPPAVLNCPANPPCGVDCKVSQWTVSKCSVTCGTGTQTKTRSVLVPPQHGGKACPVLSLTLPCYRKPCPVHCAWSGFGQWSACSKTCGGGTQSRSRSVVRNAANGGRQCSGPASVSRSCNTHACPVNCAWSGFGQWSACSKTCGGGTQSRSRSVVRNAANGGRQCSGPASVSRSCNTHACPVSSGPTSHFNNLLSNIGNTVRRTTTSASNVARRVGGAARNVFSRFRWRF